MMEISTYRTSLSPIQLNIKHNNSSTLSNLNSFLQDTSSLEGTVTGIDKDALIFTTIQGKFSLAKTSDSPAINKGDQLVVNLSVDSKTGKVLAQLLSVNKIAIKYSQLIPIKVIELTHRQPLARSTINTNLENVSISSTSTLPKVFTAKVNYLNLNNINQNSQLYSGLNILRKGSNVEFAISTKPDNKLPVINQIPAEITDLDAPVTLIKTPFGILELESKELPISKKFYIVLKTINGQELIARNAQLSSQEFLFKLSGLLSSCKNVIINQPNFEQHIDFEQSQHQLDSLPQLVRMLENVIRDSENKQQFIKLITVDTELKPLIQIVGAKDLNDLILKINNNQISFEQLSLILKSQKYKDLIIRKGNIHLSHKSAQRTRLFSENHLNLEQDTKVNNIIDHLTNFSAQSKLIQELSEDFSQLKELLFQSTSATNDEQWYWLSVPTFTDEEVIKHKIFINRQHNQQIRFVVDLPTKTLGDIQLEGLIKLNAQDRKPEAFDLAFRLNNKLNRTIQAQITELYQLGLSLSNIEGTINFTFTENLSKFNNIK